MRDLLHPTNNFRSLVLHPILDIGHSIGASQLAMSTIFRPALLTGLVLLDPILIPNAEMGIAGWLEILAVKQPNVWDTSEWESRGEAER